jgi:hypothetical protein
MPLRQKQHLHRQLDRFLFLLLVVLAVNQQAMLFLWKVMKVLMVEF